MPQSQCYNKFCRPFHSHLAKTNVLHVVTVKAHHTMASTTPRRAGDAENVQPPNSSVVETVQSAAEQVPDKITISPVIGTVSPPDPRDRALADQRTPTSKKTSPQWRFMKLRTKKTLIIKLSLTNWMKLKFYYHDIIGYDNQQIHRYLFNRGPGTNLQKYYCYC